MILTNFPPYTFIWPCKFLSQVCTGLQYSFRISIKIIGFKYRTRAMIMFGLFKTHEIFGRAFIFKTVLIITLVEYPNQVTYLCKDVLKLIIPRFVAAIHQTMWCTVSKMARFLDIFEENAWFWHLKLQCNAMWGNVPQYWKISQNSTISSL